jgi:dTDP-4-dehydrorhamnose 3,5-epimerase-like enzyme
MGKLSEAKALREEAYMFVSEVYNPEHPIVLKIGCKLVDILLLTNNYYDAERSARVCYDSLTCAPMNPNSSEAAQAASNLAKKWSREC